MSYNRSKAVDYAHRWAYGRNPHYFDFEGLGGDCTNFVSQCIYAGGGAMNYTPDTGWFYNSPTSRSAAWSGVPYLHTFLTLNQGRGPFGHEAPLIEAFPGDVIQLSFDGVIFTHSLLIVRAGSPAAPDNILIAAHTFNADNRALETYAYARYRLLKIDGVRRH